MMATSTSLPYIHDNNLKGDGRNIYYFPTEEVKEQIDTRLWINLQLTQFVENDFQRETLLRVFPTGTSNYRLGLLDTGSGDNSKLLLITVKPDGTIIDALEVGVIGYHLGVEQDINVKQFEITVDRKIKVYQIIPTNTNSILFENSDCNFTGQRVDSEYQINSNGQFVKTKETKYVSKLYGYYYLIFGKWQFKEGNESKL